MSSTTKKKQKMLAQQRMLEKRRKEKKIAISIAVAVVIIAIIATICGIQSQQKALNTPINFQENLSISNQALMDPISPSDEELTHPIGAHESERVQTLCDEIISDIYSSKDKFSSIKDYSNWELLNTVKKFEVTGFENQVQGEYIAGGIYDVRTHSIYINSIMIEADNSEQKFLVTHELLHSVFSVGLDYSITKGYGSALNEGFTDLATCRVLGYISGSTSYYELQQIATQIEYIYGDEIWICLAEGDDNLIQEDFDSCLYNGAWVKFNQLLDAFNSFITVAADYPDAEQMASFTLTGAQEMVCNYFIKKVADVSPQEQHTMRSEFEELLIWPDDSYFKEILGY